MGLESYGMRMGGWPEPRLIQQASGDLKFAQQHRHAKHGFVWLAPHMVQNLLAITCTCTLDDVDPSGCYHFWFYFLFSPAFAIHTHIHKSIRFDWHHPSSCKLLEQAISSTRATSNSILSTNHQQSKLGGKKNKISLVALCCNDKFL